MAPITLTVLAQQQDGTIVGPRTKKNSPQVIPHAKRKDGTPMVLLVPSEAYRTWHRAARRELLRTGVCQRDGKGGTWAQGIAIDYPVNCRALFYRDRNVGDANGFYQGIADFLQDMGILEDDRWIKQWDGSRLLKDKDRPRVEIELTPIGDCEPEPKELFADVEDFT